MKYLKKTAALALCLLISASASIGCMTAFADTDDDIVLTDTTEAPEVEELTEGDFTYHLDEDGNAVIDGCSVDEEEIVIPAELGGAAVTALSGQAFDSMPICKRIVLPGTLTEIDESNPFMYCEDLEEIAIDGASQSFAAVDGVLFSKDMTRLICYPQKKSGKSYTVPEGVLTLGIAAMYNTELEEVDLPSTADTLLRHSLSYNENLRSIDMSGTAVSTVGIMAFANCTSLSDVIFSDDLYSIEMGAFMNCERLLEIDLPDGLVNVGQAAFLGNSMIKVRIPASVQTIGYSAFGYDADEVAIPGFLIVGASNSAAQTYCTDTDEEYDYANDFDFLSFESEAAAEEYAKLNPQTYGDFEYSVNDDGEATILYCSATTYLVTVPSEIEGYPVTSIYKYAFANSSLGKVVIPNSVKTIGEDAFASTLQALELPGSLETIEGEEPFVFCTSLQTITVTEGDGNFSSQDGVLYNKDKTLLIAYPGAKPDDEFKAPDTVKEIAISGFCYNPYLETVDLSSVEIIGHYAFEGCPSLKEVKLSKNLKELGVNAFLGCTEMKSLRIYDKVESIGAYAFGYFYDEELATEIEENAASYAMAGETVVMPYSVMEDFKLYTDEGTLAYTYASDCGIQTITGTVQIGSVVVTKSFVAVIIGILAAALAALLGIFGFKKVRKAKAAKDAKKPVKKITVEPDKKDDETEGQEETENED